MHKEKNITKEYKFIVLDYSQCFKIGQDDWDTEKLEYRFVNKSPKYSLSSILHPGQKFKVRSYFSNSLRGSKPFLKDDEPANEGYLTKALVEKIKSEIAEDAKILKGLKEQLRTYAWAGKGFVDMTMTYKHSIERVERRLKNQRGHLRIWKKKYETLRDTGIYTYLELLR